MANNSYVDNSALITVLDQTISPDPKELNEAQAYLEQAAATNLAEFFLRLCQVLANPNNSDVSRMAAGLQVKNHIVAKDATTKQEKHQRWLAIDPNSRNQIKQLVLSALGTENKHPSSAAQVVAGIACAEIPLQQWPDLINTLVAQAANEQSTCQLREAVLEAIGYICADIEPKHLEEHSNEILTAIVHGMRKVETSDGVKYAATNAMLNSLEFTKANFERENERNFIMQVICESTQSGEMRICVTALQCLVKIMSLYYVYMEGYMAPALFAITVEAMKSSEDNVCLQGIEFWSNVCDEEIDLAIELSEAEELGQPPERNSKFYAKGALQYLCPILLDILARQDDMDDEDDWNPSKAAGVCLMLLASCVGNDILDYVIPFININITNDNWKYRDAAMMAMGSILDGPVPENLSPLVESKMASFKTLLSDKSIIVRDTTAWAVGRVCELIPNAVINEMYLMPLLESMVISLEGEPRVATNICWAFTSLAEAAYEAAQMSEDCEEPTTYCMSGVYKDILTRLLQTTDRADGGQNNLRSAAYEAVMEMIKNSPKDCYEVVCGTIEIIMDRITKLLELEDKIKSSSDRSQYNDLQSLLCATLQSVMRKAEKNHILGISEVIMKSLLDMLRSSSGAGGVQEDALLAVGTLTEVVGEKFMHYFEPFKQFLYAGLRNHAEYQVCIVSVGIVGDICRAVGKQILPHCDEIVTILLEDLSNSNVHRSVKPHILSVFGDISLAIGTNFVKYLEVVLDTLQQAAQAQVDKSDFDMVDYLNELREGCLEAYTGIIQGLKGDGLEINQEVFLVKERIIFMLSFIEAISADDDRSEAAISASSGLVGDLCTAFGPNFGPHLIQLLESKPRINDLLTEGRRSKNSKTKSLATWATKEMRKLRNKA